MYKLYSVRTNRGNNPQLKRGNTMKATTRRNWDVRKENLVILNRRKCLQFCEWGTGFATLSYEFATDGEHLYRIDEGVYTVLVNNRPVLINSDDYQDDAPVQRDEKPKVNAEVDQYGNLVSEEE